MRLHESMRSAPRIEKRWLNKILKLDFISTFVQWAFVRENWFPIRRSQQNEVMPRFSMKTNYFVSLIMAFFALLIRVADRSSLFSAGSTRNQKCNLVLLTASMVQVLPSQIQRTFGGWRLRKIRALRAWVWYVQPLHDRHEEMQTGWAPCSL